MVQEIYEPLCCRLVSAQTELSTAVHSIFNSAQKSFFLTLNGKVKPKRIVRFKVKTL